MSLFLSHGNAPAVLLSNLIFCFGWMNFSVPRRWVHRCAEPVKLKSYQGLNQDWALGNSNLNRSAIHCVKIQPGTGNGGENEVCTKIQGVHGLRSFTLITNSSDA